MSGPLLVSVTFKVIVWENWLSCKNTQIRFRMAVFQLRIKQPIARDCMSDFSSTRAWCPCEPAPLIQHFNEASFSCSQVCNLSRASETTVTAFQIKRPHIFSNAASQMALESHSRRAIGILKYGNSVCSIKDMHCQWVSIFLWSPVEWPTFCQNSSAALVFAE